MEVNFEKGGGEVERALQPILLPFPLLWEAQWTVKKDNKYAVKIVWDFFLWINPAWPSWHTSIRAKSHKFSRVLMNPPHQIVPFAFLLALDVWFFFFKYWLLFEPLAQCPQTHFSAVMEFSLTYRLQRVTTGKLSRFWRGREIVNDVHCHSLIFTSLQSIDIVSWGPGNIFIFKSFGWRKWICWIDKVALFK